ncbi:MAG: hypothetical protein GWP91_13330 [Rhodobacterales bacterium]|nr:hypothetical protein [Rhodobacterales bacterium]
MASLLVQGCGPKISTNPDLSLPELQQEIGDVGAEATLIAGTQSLEPNPRSIALGWLIRTSPDPGGGAWAAQGLYDPSSWVQRASVLALLSRLPEPDSLHQLESYLGLASGDPYVRGMAGVHLATVSTPLASKTLSVAWRAENENWAIAPLALASAAHGDEEAIGAVATAVATAEFALELDFIHDLGTSGHAALLTAVQHGADYAEEEVQLPFAVALIQLGDPSGEQVLRKALTHPDPEIRADAIATLIRLDHPTATALLQRARNDKVQLLSWQARLGLAARSAQDGMVFEQASTASDPEVRALAIQLGAVAYRHPVAGASKRTRNSIEQVIVAGLSDPVDTVRLPAVNAVASLQLASAIPQLQPLVRHPWEQLRIEAAGTLLLLD